MKALLKARYVVRGGAWGHAEERRFRASRRSHANGHDRGAPELANHGFRTFRPARLAVPKRRPKSRA